MKTSRVNITLRFIHTYRHIYSIGRIDIKDSLKLNDSLSEMGHSKIIPVGNGFRHSFYRYKSVNGSNYIEAKASLSLFNVNTQLGI